MKCTTKVCNGIIVETGNWKKNRHCEYVEAECPICLMTYWIVKRNNKKFIKDRRANEFEHRTNRSN